jgi:hypothetical protein
LAVSLLKPMVYDLTKLVKVVQPGIKKAEEDKKKVFIYEFFEENG